jgi:hypothetical protein
MHIADKPGRCALTMAIHHRRKALGTTNLRRYEIHAAEPKVTGSNPVG